MKEIKEKIARTNEQRVVMVLTLISIMKSKEASFNLKSSIAASMIEMLETTMIEEDTDIIKLLNKEISELCLEAKKQYGIDNYRTKLIEVIKASKKEIKERVYRITSADDILNTVNFNLN